MKRYFLLAVIFINIIVFASCNNPSKKQNQENTETTDYKDLGYRRLVGTIQGRGVVLHLIESQQAAIGNPNSEEGGFSGTFITEGNNAPLIISGHRVKDSVIQLIAHDRYHSVDTLKGILSDSTFKGKIKGPGGKYLSFQFKEKYPEGSLHWQVASFNDSLKIMPDSSRTQAIATTDLMSLWPVSKKDSASLLPIEKVFSQSFYKQSESFSSADKLLHSVSNEFFLKFKKEVNQVSKKEEELRPNLQWSYLAYMNLTSNANQIISLIYTQYQFLGGANGVQKEFGYAMNLKSGKRIKLADLFKPGYEKTLQQKLEEKFRKEYNIPKGAALNGKKGLLFEKHLKISSNFYLTPYGIGFIYNPVEVAPHVVGVINLYLPNEELKELLRK